MRSKRYTFNTIILVVLITGMTQGLTIPLLTLLLDKMGVSSVANGFNAACLYIGMLLVSPFMERVLRKYGYRNTIFIGLVLAAVPTLLFPVYHNYVFWLVLRFILGIGDYTLGYASQMWITSIADKETRGRDISLYGLAYGIGFSIGPYGIPLLPFGTWVPFEALSIFFVAAWLLLRSLQNMSPLELEEPKIKQNRFLIVIQKGWIALIPSFLYGYMEALLNSNFPIFVLRHGFNQNWISIILSSFVIGGLILQLPLGAVSDRLGRRNTMLVCACLGGIVFASLPLVSYSAWLLVLFLGVAGAVVGSFYSLGLAFATDILPAAMIPTAGMIAGVNYSIASIAAPNLNGFLIEYTGSNSMFYLLGCMLGLYTILGGILSRRKRQEQVVTNALLQQ